MSDLEPGVQLTPDTIAAMERLRTSPPPRNTMSKQHKATTTEANVLAKMHSTSRTSPFGEDYIGTCFLCGKTGLSVDNMEECENPKGLAQGEALIEAIEGASDSNA
jgi:hypothetical protein